MNVREAKSQVIELLSSQLGSQQFRQLVNPASPDAGDDGKFSILGKPARAIHRFDGWHMPINLDWFVGAADPPKIRKGEFYWYAIAIPKLSGYTRPHYLICDFLRMREWVLDFQSPRGSDYRNQRYWRADIELHERSNAEGLGYFRWGDEPHGVQGNTSRIVLLDNISEMLTLYSREEPARRMVAEVSRPVRDTLLTAHLKKLYGNRCQICGSAIGIPGNTYSEAHHVKPLGYPHNGPDVENNMLILCPNHHVEFDLGFIAVRPNSTTLVHVNPKNEFNGRSLTMVPTHKLDSRFILYHYARIFITNATSLVRGPRDASKSF